jgi:hypothetical protein
MCHPFTFALYGCFVVIFTGLGIWGATKHSDTCDVYCKSLTFIGVFGVAWIATYVGFLTCIPSDAIVCDGTFRGNYNGQTARVFDDVKAQDVLFWMRTPCCFPCRIIRWMKTLVICCPSPALSNLANAETQIPQASAPPQVGEPKNPV